MSFTRRGVSAKDRKFFIERLALMLDTGSSLHASLESLGQQVDNPRLREILEALQQDVSSGMAFSQAVAKHPQVFSRTYVNLIEAGERAGIMPAVLEQLMEMEDKQMQLRSSLLSAFYYPAFLVCFSVAVVLFVLIVVFPKFGPLFANIADELPPTTLFLMAASNFLRKYWILVIAASAVAGFITYRWLSRPEGAATIDRLKLRLPVVREIFAQIYLSQFLRVMGLSLANGVSVPDALQACREIVDNVEFRGFLDRVQRQVHEGKGVSAGFQGTDFVPPLVRQMIATGDESGNVSVVMTRVAVFYEREFMRRLSTLSKLVEPLMLLVMGVVVGLVVASLILPIFKLSRAVG
jgi:type II secretory pathway component PulF